MKRFKAYLKYPERASDLFKKVKATIPTLGRPAKACLSYPLSWIRVKLLLIPASPADTKTILLPRAIPTDCSMLPKAGNENL